MPHIYAIYWLKTRAQYPVLNTNILWENVENTTLPYCQRYGVFSAIKNYCWLSFFVVLFQDWRQWTVRMHRSRQQLHWNWPWPLVGNAGQSSKARGSMVPLAGVNSRAHTALPEKLPNRLELSECQVRSITKLFINGLPYTLRKLLLVSFQLNNL